MDLDTKEIIQINVNIKNENEENKEIFDNNEDSNQSNEETLTVGTNLDGEDNKNVNYETIDVTENYENVEKPRILIDVMETSNKSNNQYNEYTQYIRIEDLEHPNQSYILDYLCPLCNGILYEPVVDSNVHSFCSPCIEKYINSCKSALGEDEKNTFPYLPCPYKLKSNQTNDVCCDFSSLKTIPLLKNIIYKQMIYCRNRLSECNWKGRIHEMTIHISNECLKEYVKCQYDCIYKARREDVIIHEANCDMRIVNCNYCLSDIAHIKLSEHYKICLKYELRCEYCKNLYKREDNQHHLIDVCPMTIINCSYSSLGCMKVTKREEMNDHLLKEQVLHNQLILDLVKGCNSLNKEYFSKIEEKMELILKEKGKENEKQEIKNNNDVIVMDNKLDAEKEIITTKEVEVVPERINEKEKNMFNLSLIESNEISVDILGFGSISYDNDNYSTKFNMKDRLSSQLLIDNSINLNITKSNQEIVNIIDTEDIEEIDDIDNIKNSDYMKKSETHNSTIAINLKSQDDKAVKDSNLLNKKRIQESEEKGEVEKENEVKQINSKPQSQSKMKNNIDCLYLRKYFIESYSDLSQFIFKNKIITFSSQSSYILTFNKSYSNKTFECSIKLINSLKILVGVTIKQVVEKTNYHFNKQLKDHGIFAIGAEGYAFNSRDSNNNCKFTSEAVASLGDCLHFKYDIKSKELYFRVNSYSVIVMKVYCDPDEDIVPCIIFNEKNGSIFMSKVIEG